MSDTAPANRDQAALWNEAGGQAWVEMNDILDRLLAPFEATLTDAAFPGEGASVLDIGCGAGATTLAMARRLGPDGLALGADISAPLVAAAKARAEATGLRNAAFIAADAQTFRFDPGVFDAAISRFGVMFFDDPERAFANVRRAVRPGGRLTFIVWRGPAENPFMTAGARAAAPFLPDLKAPDPDAPGQFAFADADKVRRILDVSGWREMDVARLDVANEVPEADLMAYVTKLGPAGIALRDADAATKAKVTDALADAFRPFIRDGAARFTSACWLATARAP